MGLRLRKYVELRRFEPLTIIVVYLQIYQSWEIRVERFAVASVVTWSMV